MAKFIKVIDMDSSEEMISIFEHKIDDEMHTKQRKSLSSVNMNPIMVHVLIHRAV